jgi:hypothetical protein
MSKRPRTAEQPLSDLQPESLFQGSRETDGDFAFTIFSKARNETFSSRGRRPKRHTIDAVVSIPAAEDECPLTLDLIADSRLPFMPDAEFIQGRAKHTKLTLPCRHSFSALTLLYSFCKNNMICPCCRAGEDVRADPNCLPPHLRAEFKAQIQRTLETERRQDEERGMRDAVESFSLFGVTIPYEILGVNGNLKLLVNLYDMPEGAALSATSVRPAFSYSCPLRPARDPSTGRLSLSQNGQLRSLNNLASAGINSIQLSVQLSMHGTGDVLIDTTPIVRLPALPQPRMVIPGASGSSVTRNNQFQVLVQLRNGNETESNTSFALDFARQGIDNITWRPESENLEILSSNFELAAML